jgi:hypothetical protein
MRSGCRQRNCHGRRRDRCNNKLHLLPNQCQPQARCLPDTHLFMCAYMSVCVCVCVCWGQGNVEGGVKRELSGGRGTVRQEVTPCLLLHKIAAAPQHGMLMIPRPSAPSALRTCSPQRQVAQVDQRRQTCNQQGHRATS